MSPIQRPIVIRPDRPEDAPALRRLAALDSSGVPTGLLLLVEEGGELRAAIAIGSGAAIADPFARTVDLVALLRVRAQQLTARERATTGSPRGRRVRLPGTAAAVRDRREARRRSAPSTGLTAPVRPRAVRER